MVSQEDSQEDIHSQEDMDSPRWGEQGAMGSLDMVSLPVALVHRLAQ
jgi:hypothetical protein